jgi:rhodanese-related sulfurtransferase/DNA-binding transcriptional ArsR family regulator
MSETSPKHQLFEQFARIGKAMSNANRLEILEFLGQRECGVDELATLCNLSVANTSQHLQLLRQAGLVTSEKRGQRVFYRLSGDDVVRLLLILRRVGDSHLAEVKQLIQQYFTVKDELEAIPASELLQRARSAQVTVVDVRPAEEYLAGHLHGAINIPVEELETRLAELSPDQEVVAYCRGPHCMLSYDAVEKLRQRGYAARRLEDGYPEWKAAGLPIETTH